MQKRATKSDTSGHCLILDVSLNESQIKILNALSRDASKGLLTGPALNKDLKGNGHTGYSINKIWLHLKQHKHWQVNYITLKYSMLQIIH